MLSGSVEAVDTPTGRDDDTGQAGGQEKAGPILVSYTSCVEFLYLLLFVKITNEQ